MCCLYLSSNHTNQLHWTITNSCSLNECRLHMDIKLKKASPDSKHFLLKISVILCSILIFICTFLISNIWNPRLNSDGFSSCNIFLDKRIKIKNVWSNWFQYLALPMIIFFINCDFRRIKKVLQAIILSPLYLQAMILLCKYMCLQQNKKYFVWLK